MFLVLFLIAVLAELVLASMFLKLASYQRTPEGPLTWIVAAMVVVAFVAGSLAERAL